MHIKVLLFFMLPALACAGGTPEIASLRVQFLQSARPEIRRLFDQCEQQIGKPVIFSPLPDNDHIVARGIVHQANYTGEIMRRRGWEDLDVADELLHLRMDLAKGFHCLPGGGMSHTHPP